MQTDQETQSAQGDAQKQTDDKTPNESEEMEVRCSFSMQYKFIKIGDFCIPYFVCILEDEMMHRSLIFKDLSVCFIMFLVFLY